MLRSYRAKSLRSTWKPAWLGAAAEHEAGHAFPNPSQNIKIPKLVRISQEQKYLKDISHSEYFKFAVHEARHVFPKICLLSRADFDPGPVKMPNGLACIFRLDQECMFNIRNLCPRSDMNISDEYLCPIFLNQLVFKIFLKQFCHAHHSNHDHLILGDHLWNMEKKAKNKQILWLLSKT